MSSPARVGDVGDGRSREDDVVALGLDDVLGVADDHVRGVGTRVRALVAGGAGGRGGRRQGGGEGEGAEQGADRSVDMVLSVCRGVSLCDARAAAYCMGSPARADDLEGDVGDVGDDAVDPHPARGAMRRGRRVHALTRTPAAWAAAPPGRRRQRVPGVQAPWPCAGHGERGPAVLAHVQEGVLELGVAARTWSMVGRWNTRPAARRPRRRTSATTSSATTSVGSKSGSSGQFLISMFTAMPSLASTASASVGTGLGGRRAGSTRTRPSGRAASWSTTTWPSAVRRASSSTASAPRCRRRRRRPGCSRGRRRRPPVGDHQRSGAIGALSNSGLRREPGFSRKKCLQQ